MRYYVIAFLGFVCGLAANAQYSVRHEHYVAPPGIMPRTPFTLPKALEYKPVLPPPLPESYSDFSVLYKGGMDVRRMIEESEKQEQRWKEEFKRMDAQAEAERERRKRENIHDSYGYCLRNGALRKMRITYQLAPVNGEIGVFLKSLYDRDLGSSKYYSIKAKNTSVMIEGQTVSWMVQVPEYGMLYFNLQ